MELQLKQKSNYLEKEKENFMAVMNEFIDGINLEEEQIFGRPKIDYKTILKSLLIVSYHNFSYRRACTDIENLGRQGFITQVPKRSTVAKYMLDSEITKILQKLISHSARSFADVDHTIIFDSSWFSHHINFCVAHKRKINQRKLDLPPHYKTRKLHIACFVKSKMIVSALVSPGTQHDSPFFKILLKDIMDNGFNVKKILADKGYMSRRSMELCEDYGITEVFIDFKKNASFKRPKSTLWKKRLKLFQEEPELWQESFRFRVLIESLFSGMKRKHNGFLRSKKEISMDNEILLKAFVHNLTILGKFIDDL